MFKLFVNFVVPVDSRLIKHRFCRTISPTLWILMIIKGAQEWWLRYWRNTTVGLADPTINFATGVGKGFPTLTNGGGLDGRSRVHYSLITSHSICSMLQIQRYCPSLLAPWIPLWASVFIKRYASFCRKSICKRSLTW